MVTVSNFVPRRGVLVMPPGWEDHHRHTLNATHTAAIDLWSGPVDGNDWIFDPVTKTEVRNHGDKLTTIPLSARIQRLASEQTTTAGGQIVAIRRYLIALDRNLADNLAEPLSLARRLQVVEINDGYLQGRWLSIQDIQGGSLRFERHLVVHDNIEASH